ncbi:MAG: hypothetical protein RR216_02565 [Pseudoflavonifractor sp.]
MDEKQIPLWRRLLPLVVFLVALVAAILVVTRVLSVKASAEGLVLAERNLRRAAVECYALEGFYPDSADYLAAHYGCTLDERRFIVHYEFVASNLMPEITVLPPA